MESHAHRASVSRPRAANAAPVFDRDRLRALTDGDREFEHELVETYKESVRHILAQLRAHVSKGDAGGITREAHALKGASINVGAVSISNCAGEIEAAARAGNVSAVREKLHDLAVEEQALWLELQLL